MGTNYIAAKTEDLELLIKEYGLDATEYTNENGSLNRKKLNNVLKAIDIATGKVRETLLQKPGETTVEFNPTGKKLHKNLSGMMVQITFYSTDENDLPYLQMALNGLCLQIPRETKVWIPKEFVDGVLQNAVMTKMKLEYTENGQVRYIPKQVPRVQYTVHQLKHLDVLRDEFTKKKQKAQQDN